MGKVVVKNQACLNDVCGSHDARQIYEDGTSFCFSCRSFFGKQEGESIATTTTAPNFFKKQVGLDEIKDLPIRGFKERKITKEVSEFFDVKVSYGENGEIDTHYYPYDDGKAYKVRKLPKEFHWVSKSANLFGQTKFNGGGKRLIITEGEIDALSIAQASLDKYKKIYPVVAMSSATMTKALLENRDWIRTFNEVVLCLDNDEAGQSATQKIAKIIGFDKIKVAQLPEKDPCDVLVKHGAEQLMKCLFDAKEFSPVGVLRGEDIWNHFTELKNTISLPYPKCLNGLNTKLRGMRLGEIALFTSGTGSGKSTVIKEIVLEILDKTPDMVGMVSLEESIGDTAQKFIGMVLNKNLSEENITEEEQYEGFKKVFGDERLVLLDHQGSVSDESLVDKIEHLALMGCKYLILDHITIAVSEGAKGKTGNEAVDSIMSDLLKITKKHNIWLGIISHLRKGERPFEEGHLPSIDDIKGSGSIKQISFDIVAFARNMIADSDTERNTINLRVLKSRFTGHTGDCGSTIYNTETGRLNEVGILDFDIAA